MPDAILHITPTTALLKSLGAVERSGRWTPKAKQTVLELLDRGALGLPQVCARFDLSAEEVQGWKRRDARHGRDGLAIRRLQELRL